MIALPVWGALMVETAETLLTRVICARSGLPEAALGEDAGLFSAGVDEDDLHEAFVETCKALRLDPASIRVDPVTLPNGWLLTSLRHLGPFWAHADLARRDLEATVSLPPEPTIRSLAETVRQGRLVAAGPAVPVPSAPPLTRGRVASRAGSVAILTLFAAPALWFLGCKPVCHVCPSSMSQAVDTAVPTSLPVLVTIGAAVLLPGLLHLRQRAATSPLATG